MFTYSSQTPDNFLAYRVNVLFPAQLVIKEDTKVPCCLFVSQPSCSTHRCWISEHLFFLPRNILWVFLILTVRQFCWSHWTTVWKPTVSFCFTSSAVFPWQYTMVSSAYSWILQELTTAGKGPSVEPWGTPLLIGFREDLASLIATHYMQPWR